jgi:hypothetical protein
MKGRLVILVLVSASIALATRAWSPAELKRYEESYQPRWCPRPETITAGPRRFNYLKRIKWVCDFVARYQVADSLSPDFGGIIEAEHLPTVIETDNTQEAIWVWTRWYQLTGSNTYQENIGRAWRYVLRHPAYQEHGGNPSYLWYAVWNCGLGLWAEALYQQVYQDSSFLAYADSCRDFYLTHPLNPADILNNLVTAQASGMAYDYALKRNDSELLDTALARGMQVKNWIEANAGYRLSYQNWAMSGGTAFWGICHTFGQADTVAGKIWVQTYAESLPGFYPTGTWNCSHNLWLANAYYAAAEIGNNQQHRSWHQYLTDTLLMRDTDLDGGIPATWTDPNTQDQTWVSTYLDFMGMDELLDSLYPLDIAVYQFLAPISGGLYVEPFEVTAIFPIENVGTTPISGTIHCRLDSSEQTRLVSNLPVWVEETLSFQFPSPLSRGIHHLQAFFTEDENPKNDSIQLDIKVYGRFTLSGLLLDSLTRAPISARVRAYLGNDTAVWDSCTTSDSGRFSLCLIDSIFQIAIEPQPPYYRHNWTVALSSDTAITFLAAPAQVMVVNNDSLGNYNLYYTATLDTLGINWCLWQRRQAGPLPGRILERLQNQTVIWFSGNSSQQTLPQTDQETLAQFLTNGGNLILTGQNIAEELSGTNFLENIIGCRFDSSGWRGFLVFGNRGDSLGRHVTGIATAGGNGANNQNSRDAISPVANATLFLVYDTITNLGAGIKREISQAGKVIFLGFGFEAVNRPAARPEYFTRVQLMNLMLNWLFTGIGIPESPANANSQPDLSILPAIFTSRLVIKTGQPAQINIFDITGRTVARIQTGSGTTVWQTPSLPAGIYFARTGQSPTRALVKIR